MAEKLNQYEAMFLMGPKGTTEPEGAVNLCRSVIERHGGQIIVIKKWDERKLAYEIGRQKRGLYVLAFFRCPPAAVANIEREVRLSEDIVRVLILRADHLNEQEMAAMEPQPPAREERSGHDRGEWSSEGPGQRPGRARREEHVEEAEKDAGAPSIEK